MSFMEANYDRGSGCPKRKDEVMRYRVKVKKARELEAESYVVTPQHPSGPLLVHMIDGIE
jgi:hypothetical protein